VQGLEPNALPTELYLYSSSIVKKHSTRVPSKSNGVGMTIIFQVIGNVMLLAIIYVRCRQQKTESKACFCQKGLCSLDCGHCTIIWESRSVIEGHFFSASAAAKSSIFCTFETPLLKALSNEMAANPIIFFESPPIFTAMEYFKYYHATC
jgi:hypothetical protein